ncbi:hypothetical protein GGF42_001281 [Coemansia sp. RSA 2424]|nr:hypothetical protein GGF42_001281 [Coemansia sp. RSA 2424]
MEIADVAEVLTYSHRRFGRRHLVSEADSQDLERQQALIDEMNMLTCDTPEYNDFVSDFMATHANDSQPTVKLARKFCETWPLPSKTSAATETIRVAVMDSSFNPPHYCHGAYMECMGTMQLRAAADVAEGHQQGETHALEIDAFLLLLGSLNADKLQKGMTLGQRMRMVDMLGTTIALDTTSDTWHLWKKRDQFNASNLHNMAIGMVNVPRFIDKYEAVRNAVLQELKLPPPPPNDDRQLLPRVLCYFAMGWDTLIRFFDEKYYGPDYQAEISRFFDSGGRIAYARRVGFSDTEVSEFFAAPHLAPYLQFIYELELPKRVKHISSTEVRQAIRESSQSVRDIPPRILQFVNSNQLYRNNEE